MAAELTSDELLDFTILCGMTGPWKWSLIFLAYSSFLLHTDGDTFKEQCLNSN